MLYLDLVESGDYNLYAWGVDIFNITLDACSKKCKTKLGYYKLGGFSVAL